MKPNRKPKLSEGQKLAAELEKAKEATRKHSIQFGPVSNRKPKVEPPARTRVSKYAGCWVIDVLAFGGFWATVYVGKVGESKKQAVDRWNAWNAQQKALK